MATVHPYKGYLNSEFHFYARGTKDVEYSIFSNNGEKENLMRTGTFSPNIPHSIKLKEAGTFRVDFNDGTSSEITIEDGYKFGGGKYKNSFIFDNCPWVFIVMHDRTYFYNRETEKSYVEPISPDIIEEVSNDYVIFLNSNHSERTVFSLVGQKPILNVSNIIFYNEDVILWNEDDEIIAYSLNNNTIVYRIKPLQYLIDRENNQILYATSQSIFILNLFDDFQIKELHHWKGDFLAIIDSKLSAYSISEKQNMHLQVVNHLTNELIKDIIIDGYISSVNERTFIDMEVRHTALQNYDLNHTEFPEATITVRYHDFIFYPCEWDIYYMEKETMFTKRQNYFHTDETIALHSMNTDLNQPFKQFKNSVRITDIRFLIFNDNESFVRSKFYTSAGYNNGKIHTHQNIIILEKDNYIRTLSKNGYWDNPIKCEYYFSLFEDYGVIYDNEKQVYKSLVYDVIDRYSVPINFYPIKHIKIGELKILPGGNNIIGGEEFYQIITKRSNIIEHSLNISKSLKFCVLKENGRFFILHLDSHSITKRAEILHDLFDNSEYRQVLLDECGAQILYRNSDKTEIKDIESGEIITYDNLSYVKQCNGIRPSFQQSSSLQPCIVNPITGQTLDCELMKKFNFISPNGCYYAETIKDMYEEQYYLESGKTILNAEFKSLLKQFAYPSRDKKGSREWDLVTYRRIEFINKHFNYIKASFPKLTHNSTNQQKWEDCLIDENNLFGELCFIRRIIGVRGIAIIRQVSNDSIIAKIDLGTPLKYINYVAFSYDSRFVSIVGYRDSSHGMFLIYDLIEKRSLCRMNTNRAVWTTSFSSKGSIAAHTSDPTTIYFKDKFDYNFQEEPDKHLINDRNFLTFSPNGTLMALSNQGYISKYDITGKVRAGWGHQSTTFVEIRMSNNIDKTQATFHDLSNCGIADASTPKSVASVAFSNDNKRLMMVGNDGVVIIRNLHLEENAQQ